MTVYIIYIYNCTPVTVNITYQLLIIEIILGYIEQTSSIQCKMYLACFIIFIDILYTMVTAMEVQVIICVSVHCDYLVISHQ